MPPGVGPESVFASRIGDDRPGFSPRMGFVYTWKGGNLPAPDDPAARDAVLGYKEGSTGRAVLFAVSHVRWKDGADASKSGTEGTVP